ncbi:MAG: enoyl-ACP reductase FabI [Pseudomonadota bacterium]
MSFVNFHGKRGLVLGVANEHSIAWGCARLAHSLGAELVVTCVNDKARMAVEPLTRPLGLALQVCDVENPDALQALVSHAVGRFGALDFVIHSIAWAPLQDLHGRVVDSSSTGFARAMEVSCHSFASLAKCCAPHMMAGGAMVTMSYLGADQAVPHYGLMGPVKAALESLVRYMALELGPQGVRVHAVSPGPIPTRAASGIEAFDTLMQANADRAPLRRLVTLDEIANLTLFLCSDQASGMSGQTIFVDAGFHAVS